MSTRLGDVDISPQATSIKMIAMDRQLNRFRVLRDGRIEVVDPRPGDLPLLRMFDPSIDIRSTPLSGFVRPRLRQSLQCSSGIPASRLCTLSTATLWMAHTNAMEIIRAADADSERRDGTASLLELKTELADRMLRSCRLCMKVCAVDRTAGERGQCGLGTNALLAEHYIHIAEESPINPSYVFSLAGCGMRCRFCQQWPLLRPSTSSTQPLSPSLWDTVELSHARSVTFVGGNPDESLPGILRFLLDAPAPWQLPIVWNNHAYSSLDVLALLEGVVDVYLPDLKFGSDVCGRLLGGATYYAEVAERALTRMLAQDVTVIVRILILPGHARCCHLPSLRFLAQHNSRRLFVSLRGQYAPDHLVGETDPLNARPSDEDVESLRCAARDAGLRLVDDIAR